MKKRVSNGSPATPMIAHPAAGVNGLVHHDLGHDAEHQHADTQWRKSAEQRHTDQQEKQATESFHESSFTISENSPHAAFVSPHGIG